MTTKYEAMREALERFIEDANDYGSYGVKTYDSARAALAMPDDDPVAGVLPACAGANCGCIDGKSHSKECLAEHDATVSAGELDTPGNRWPELRYAGYKGYTLKAGATSDQMRAYREGQRAALMDGK